MTLIVEADPCGDFAQRKIGFGNQLTGGFDAKAAHVLAHRAAIMTAKLPRQINRMHLGHGTEFGEIDIFGKPRVQHFSNSPKPRRNPLFIKARLP